MRTVGEVRHAFSKHGGNLGQDGSVAFLFNRTGVLHYPAGMSEDRIMEAALEAGDYSPRLKAGASTVFH